MMKNILCYGDSNTFGTDPVHGGRHSYIVRWTGRLQKLLGDDYYVIEEGCGGRTTVFDDVVSCGRNGLSMLTPCIASHNPLDLIIVMLGTNDLKHRFQATVWDLGKAMEQIIDKIRQFPFAPWYSCPPILVVSPIHIKAGVEESIYGCFTKEAVSMSQLLAGEYIRVCNEKECYFFDASTVAEASERDKIHMEADAHGALAEALAEKALKILNKKYLKGKQLM